MQPETGETSRETYPDLDSALAELGMLSQPSSFSLQYKLEADRVKAGRGTVTPLYRVPTSSSRHHRDTVEETVLDPAAPRDSSLTPLVTVNTEFVTNICVSGTSERLENAARIRRMSGPPALWPRRSRIITSPYIYLPRVPGIPSPTSTSLTRLRGRVRFSDLHHSPSSHGHGPAYLLDEELTSKLEAIRLEPGAAYSCTNNQFNTNFGTGSQTALCKDVESLDLRPSEEASLFLSDEETE